MRHASGASTAFIDSGDGSFTSVRELLVEAVLVAYVMAREYGLTPGLRLAFYLPNDVQAIIWISAAKRLGMPYAAVSSGTSSRSLASRIDDTRVVAVHSLNFNHNLRRRRARTREIWRS